MDTKELSKMEAAVKDAQQKVKDELVAKAEATLAELRTVGFDFKLVENGAVKMGRPRKEPNAKAQVG
jgi:hypothetical protein